ncbi:glutathione S-transferase family protein [Chamaesiphon sp.]|uniref:glutathione S-transferase family protein n=1 Tax=Chamaesiphon sp. TaxID=2814140 RepID=UPI00359321E7
MSKLIVYGLTASTYVRTVRLLLEEIGVEYTIESVNIFNGENQTAEYLAKHPFGKVPTLDVDGELLYETAAITQYLDTVLANHKYSPAEPLLLARMRQIMGIIDGYFYAPAIGTIVIQRLTGKIDEAKLNAAIAPAKKALEAIESLVTTNPYLLGSDITIADFYLIPLCVYLSTTPEFAPLTAQTPKLLAWWEIASQLPNVKKVCV